MAKRIAMVAFPDAQLLDIVGPLEVFSRADRLLTDEGKRPASYVVEVIARTAGPITMSSGITVVASRTLAQLKRGASIDTLLVSGGRGVQAELAAGIVPRFLARMAPHVRRLGSVCTGAFLLAATGLLDGKRATTHWRSVAKLAAQFPRLTVEPDAIFVREGKLFTSAGVTSGIDLALALVEDDHGPEIAREAARELVMFLQRPGGQAQFSAQLAHPRASRDTLAEVQAWIPEHLDDDLSITALARRAAMSPRNFARVFSEEVGTTPARFVERIRVEAARAQLEQSAASVDEVAAGCGFGTAESMRRVFIRQLRIPPSAYRARFADHADHAKRPRSQA